MKKNVVISLMGVQRYDETPPDVIELVTQGQLHEEEDVALVLTYEESELTGLAGGDAPGRRVEHPDDF